MNDPLQRMDSALIALRHLWTAPPRIQDPALGSVEMSTIWVTDSLTREATLQSVSDVAAHLGVAHSTASRLIARAERAEAVVRSPLPQDSRRVAVHLTERGRALARAALQFRLQILEQATADWTADERETFADLLTRFASTTTEPKEVP